MQKPADDFATNAGTRGQLRVYLGYAPGAGQTRAMLRAGRALADEGVDVVVGCIGRSADPETLAVLRDMEWLSRGRSSELDPVVALRRKPAVILVDELAHRGPVPAWAGEAAHREPRHRWRDVEAICVAGITVFSTLDLQELESMSNVLPFILSTRAAGTVPDAILEQPTQIVFVDVPPEELAQRSLEGAAALGLADLVVLRELSLRYLADRSGQGSQAAGSRAATFATSERIMVCVGPAPSSALLVREADKTARMLRAPCFAVTVESRIPMRGPDRESLRSNLRLAESLGATVITLRGPDVAAELAAYARRSGITRIIVGRTTRKPLLRRLQPPIADRLVERARDVHILVSSEGSRMHRAPMQPLRARDLVAGIGSVAAAFAVGALLKFVAGFADSNVIMVFLLVVAWVSARFGRVAGILASVLSVSVFDFFFVVPYLTFGVADTQYLLTFLVMLVISVLISSATAHVRDQARVARQEKRETESLLSMSNALVGSSSLTELATTVQRVISSSFGCETVVLLGRHGVEIRPVLPGGPTFTDAPVEREAARSAVDRHEAAGAGTTNCPKAEGYYFPLPASAAVRGAIALRFRSPSRPPSGERRRLLEGFAGQVAFASDRLALAEEVRLILMQMEVERMRSSLLSSISHDLRTPLAGIEGTAGLLAETGPELGEPERQQMTRSIVEQSQRMTRLVENLLAITRLESSDRIRLAKVWQPLEGIVTSAIARIGGASRSRLLAQLPESMILAPVDETLLEQALFNLLENALKYSPPESPVEIAVSQQGGRAFIEVRDRGPGVPDAEKTLIFRKFQRGSAARRGQAAVGSGLGLAICQAIVKAHDGTVRVADRAGGGAVFIVEIPLEGEPPALSPQGE